MSTSSVTTIKNAIKAQLASIDGSGSYTYDLSAAGRIIVGQGIPEGAPDLCLWLAQGPLDCPPGESLIRYKFSLTMYVSAFVPAAADTPESRLDAANDMMKDILLALNSTATKRILGGLVWDTTLSFGAADGQDFGRPGCGVVGGEITLTWEASTL